MPDDPISTAMRAMGADTEEPEGEEDQARAVTLLSSLAHTACDNIEKHSTTIMIILTILLIIMLKLLSAFIRSTETIGINDTIADLPLMKMRGTSTCGF